MLAHSLMPKWKNHSVWWGCPSPLSLQTGTVHNTNHPFQQKVAFHPISSLDHQKPLKMRFLPPVGGSDQQMRLSQKATAGINSRSVQLLHIPAVCVSTGVSPSLVARRSFHQRTWSSHGLSFLLPPPLDFRRSCGLKCTAITGRDILSSPRQHSGFGGIY